MPRKASARGPLRDRVLALIERHPGVHTAEVARRLGAGWTSVQHHVRGLAADGAVRSVPFGGRRALLPATYSEGLAHRILPLAEPLRARILLHLARVPAARIQSVASKMRVSRKAVRRHLDVLVQAGLVDRSRDFHPRFRITAAGRRGLVRARRRG